MITHDLGVVANIAQKIAVMYSGMIVERGSCEDIFYRPRHPYTWALIRSVPRLDLENKQVLASIPGTPPDLLNPASRMLHSVQDVSTVWKSVKSRCLRLQSLVMDMRQAAGCITH